MADTQLPTVEKKMRIIIENAIDGADISKHLSKTQKSLTRIEKQLKRQSQTWDKHTKRVQKSMERIRKSCERLTTQTRRVQQATSIAAKCQDRLNRSIRQSHRPLARHIELLKKQRRQLRENHIESGTLGRSLKSITGMIAGAGLGYLAMRRIKEVMDKRFSLALTGGPDQIAMIKQLSQGKGTTAAIDLASRFQQQSPYSRFSMGKDALQGLIQTQQSLEGIGYDRANDLILEVTKSLEPAKLKQFLETAATGNIRDAMLGAASGQNVEAITSALNALQINDLAGTGQLDPMLDAAVRIEEATNKIADQFDQLADKVAGAAQKMSNLQLALTALLAVLGGSALKGLALRGLGRGLVGRGVGRAVGRGAAKGAGSAGTAIVKHGLKLGRSGYPLLRMNPLNLPAGGIVGVGSAAAAAAGSLYTAGRSAQTAWQERKALHALQEQMQDNRLFDIAREAKEQASTPREKLAAKRKELDAMITNSAPGAGMKQDGIFAGVSDFLGFMPVIPEVNQKTLDKLREQRQKIVEQIREIDQQASTGLTKTATAAQKVGKAGEDNLKRLQRQLAERQELTLKAEQASSFTDLARKQFEISRTTPLGTVGALPEMNQLQKTLTTEIERLTKVMESIDRSTSAGVIESNKIQGEILGLKLEQRQNARLISSAMLDSIVSSAMNVGGSFEKILVTRDRNLAAGLGNNIIQQQPAFVGSVGDAARASNRNPVRITASTTDEVTALKNIARGVKDLIAISKGRPEIDLSQSATEQDRPGRGMSVI